LKHTVYVPERLFQKRAVYETTLRKFCTARQAEDGNITHAYCMLDT